MDTVTCLMGLYLGAVVFQLWTNELNGVLHCTEKSTHIYTAVQVTRGEEGIGRCEKFLSKLQDTRGRNENTLCLHV